MPKPKAPRSRKTVSSTAGAKPARGKRSALQPDNDILSEDNIAHGGGDVDARTDGTNGANDARVEDRNVTDDMGSLTAQVYTPQVYQIVCR